MAENNTHDANVKLDQASVEDKFISRKKDSKYQCFERGRNIVHKGLSKGYQRKVGQFYHVLRTQQMIQDYPKLKRDCLLNEINLDFTDGKW